MLNEFLENFNLACSQRHECVSNCSGSHHLGEHLNGCSDGFTINAWFLKTLEGSLTHMEDVLHGYESPETKTKKGILW